MASDTENEVTSLVRDMNGNALNKGDLVMVLLEKPALVGFITAINTPSLLTGGNKQQPGVLTVQGTISIPFNPRGISILQQTAKLVDPRAEGLVNAIADSVRREKAMIKLPSADDLDKAETENEAAKATSGPTLVSSSDHPPTTVVKE